MKSRSPKQRSMAQRTVAARSCALLLVGMAACSLDRSGKLACETSADCLSGYSCMAQICMRTGAPPAGQGQAGAAAREPEFTAGSGGSGATGSARSAAGDGQLAGAAGSSVAGVLASSATLRALSVDAGVLTPAFDPALHSYTLDLPLMVSAFRFTATSDAGSRILLDGTELESGAQSNWVDLDASGGMFHFSVTEQAERSEYTVQARRGQNVPRTGMLKSSDAAMNDPYGTSMALDGDTLVVGAVACVDVYRSSAGSWLHEAHLQPKNADSDDDFGTSVALSGDTLVVGALLEDSAASGIDGDRGDNSLLSAGASYVFTRSGGVWTERAYLKASNPQLGASFGASVAVSGDLIAVGAPYESSNATGSAGAAPTSGAVYLFSRSGDSWSQRAYLKASNTAAQAMFGSSLALTSNALAVGAVNEASPAPGSDQVAMGSGAVYLFNESGGIWAESALLKASNAEVNDAFGQSVAFDSDTLVVGAPREDALARGAATDPADNSAEDSGAVYVFAHAESGWVQQAYIKPDQLLAGDVFGWSVALSRHTLAAGAWAESRHDGVAYVFAAQGDAWSQRAALDSSVVRGVGFKSQSPDGFGFSLALGATTLIVGAPNEGVPIWSTPHGTCYSFE